MGWSVGKHEGRDVGYGVPAYCDHPGCAKEIDRGLGYICGHEQPGGGDEGCGRFFCSEHGGGGLCCACRDGKSPFPPSADHPDWINHKLTDESWKPWRDQNPSEVERMRRTIAHSGRTAE